MTDNFQHLPPKDKNTILEEAAIAREYLNEEQRKFAVKSLCRDRYRCGPLYDGSPTDLADQDIIEAAYGQGNADIYWKSWLLGANSRTEFVQAIAAHCAVDNDSFHRIWKTLLTALDKACVTNDLFADARWLVDNPNTSFYIPSTLTAFIRGEAPKHEDTPAEPDNSPIAEAPKEPEQPSPALIEDVVPATEVELRKFCTELPVEKRLKETDARALAQAHFAPRSVTVRLFREAFKDYPGRRLPGEHDATIDRDRSVTK